MFEFDPAKSAANLEKHGIDFEEVQAVWADTRRLEIPARTLERGKVGPDRQDRCPALDGHLHPARRPSQAHLRTPGAEGGGGPL